MPKPVGMPSSVKVGPHVYSLLRKPASAMPNTLGVCDDSLLQICIRQKMRRSKAKEVLLHEVLHACSHLTLSSFGKRAEEDFVEAITPTLLQVLQDNPELLEYLVQ